MDENGRLVDDPTMKVNIFSQIFSENFNCSDNLPLIEYAGPHTYEESNLFSLTNVYKAIGTIKSSNSLGPDGFPTSFLKQAASGLYDPILIISKFCFDNSVFPKKWKSARIVPVFKKGNPAIPANYRPVSITSPFAKVIQLIIGPFLLQSFMSTDEFCVNQHGFLPKRSGIVNLLLTYDYLTNAAENNSPIDAIFLDFSRAFDKVHHNILLLQLIKLMIPPATVRFIAAFLKDRRQYVSIDNCNSSCAPVTSGVLQGTSLSALLFTIFINSLPQYVKCSDILLFADDVKLIHPIHKGIASSLQCDLNSICEWSKIMKLPLSKEKSVILHLGKNNPGIDYTIESNNLQCVKLIKDLGVTYNSSLKFSQHFSDIVGKAYRRSYLVKNALGRCNNYFKVKAFLVFVRPILEYGSSVWNPTLIGEIKLLENVQKRFTKSLNGISNLSYQNRLEALNMISLEKRRLIIDLCLMFKIIHNLIFVPEQYQIIELLPESRTRSHDLQIKIPTVRNRHRFNYFTIRTSRVWNELQPDVVHSGSLISFKRKLHQCDLDKYLLVYRF